MLTFIGAVLIVGATTYFGLSAFWRLKLRVVVLEQLIFAVQHMEREIVGRLSPLTEVLEHLIVTCNTPVKHFFTRVDDGMREVGRHSFAHIWSMALYDSEELLLKKEERLILDDLGKALGRYDVEMQQSALAYAQKRLAGYLKHAQEEKRTQGKMHATLGVAAGFFVVLILL